MVTSSDVNFNIVMICLTIGFIVYQICDCVLSIKKDKHVQQAYMFNKAAGGSQSETISDDETMG